MIGLAAVASCLAATALRLLLGDWGGAVPIAGLAWTILFARHARRASFAAIAASCGAIEGLLLPATWTFWPLAFVVCGAIAFATRRLLPIRGAAGEIVVGTLLCALVRAVAIAFPPFGLPPLQAGFAPALVCCALTGVLGGVLLGLAHAWTPLRLRLQKPA